MFQYKINNKNIRFMFTLNCFKIGLIYIAPTLNHYPELCDRYLEIMLKISDQIRSTILLINPKPEEREGLIVKGCNSFK